ncbi:hypothetical protein M0802_005211 [Mischocyttarus mexicanus]|nr:hypothetical protein M0802_005211 [Mischocyttarus mexicanus]
MFSRLIVEISQSNNMHDAHLQHDIGTKPVTPNEMYPLRLVLKEKKMAGLVISNTVSQKFLNFDTMRS